MGAHNGGGGDGMGVQRGPSPGHAAHGRLRGWADPRLPLPWPPHIPLFPSTWTPPSRWGAGLCSVKDSDLCFRAGEACLPTEIFENTGLASALHQAPVRPRKGAKPASFCCTLRTAPICPTACALGPELGPASTSLCGRCPDTLWAS